MGKRRFLSHSIISTLALTTLILVGCAAAEPKLALEQKEAKIDPSSSVERIKRNGWGYLYNLLLEKKYSNEKISKLLSDVRLDSRGEILFKVKPLEPKNLYTKVVTTRNINNALEFYRENRDWFNQAEKRFGIEPEILLALFQVETQCGKITGEHQIFYRLARLASVNSPDNLSANYNYQPNLKFSKSAVLDRGEVLEGIFFPEVEAMIKLYPDPLLIKGSYAGALGIPQFLPSNILKFGVDANGDKAVNLMTPSDAILSTAKYLKHFKWHKNVSYKNAREVLWNYNRSIHYITAVLKLKDQIKKGL